MPAATEPGDLFAADDAVPGSGAAVVASEPLATRMRPRTLDEYVGQEHLLGPGKLLRRAIEADRLYSALFYGPPGTGKTSLAEVIARATRARFERLSGVESTVADIRRVVAAAANRLQGNPQARTILFIDEIHRFNRAQQDALLPDVERGTVRLLGATTENPFFAVNGPLVSRSQIFQLEPLRPEDLRRLLAGALQDTERGLGKYNVRLDDAAAEHLATISDGDARKCLNALEVGVLTTEPGPDGVIHFTREVAEESIQRKAVVYDPTGDGHYDTISAFIKSMRGSDPDAAIYWLAKMLYAGEDIRFIARRLVICAAEDVGLADSQALVVAVAAHQAAEFVGLPEAQIPLAQATIYIATAPKSNRSYAALNQANADVRAGITLPVPAHLRSTAYKGSKRLGHGKGYQYSHDSAEAYIPQAYLPEGRRYYEPSDRGSEKRIAERLAHWRALFEEQGGDGKSGL
jgi:putative ATPase